MTTMFPHPMWARVAADHRLAWAKERLDFELLKGAGVLMLPLREPDRNATDAQVADWDRTCDNCNTFVESLGEFFTGSITLDWDGLQVVIVYGACRTCASEGGK